MPYPPYSGRGRIYEGDATAQDRRTKDLIRRYRADEADQTSKGSVSSASAGRGNTNVGPSIDPPISRDTQVALTVPNNSTANLGPFAPKASYGGFHLIVNWQRGTTEGICVLLARHDGTTGRLFFLAGENPGWNTASFAVTIGADDVTLVLAANNNVNDIDCWIALTWLPQP